MSDSASWNSSFVAPYSSPSPPASPSVPPAAPTPAAHAVSDRATAPTVRMPRILPHRVPLVVVCVMLLLLSECVMLLLLSEYVRARQRPRLQHEPVAAPAPSGLPLWPRGDAGRRGSV